jgi:hypothetical protein
LAQHNVIVYNRSPTLVEDKWKSLGMVSPAFV